MLETTLNASYRPGTNVKGDVSGANWTFALPSLELEQVVCVGLPSGPSLRQLASIADRVLIACDLEGQHRSVCSVARGFGLNNVRPIATAGHEDLDVLDSSTDLLVLFASRPLRRFLGDAQLQTEYQRILKPGGLIYFHGRGSRCGMRRATWERLKDRFGGSLSIWLTPTAGEMHTAIAWDDARTIGYFLERGLDGKSVTPNSAKRLAGRICSGNRSTGDSSRHGLHHDESVDDVSDNASGQPGLQKTLQRTVNRMLQRAARPAVRVGQSLESQLYRSNLMRRLTGRRGTFLGSGATQLAGGPPRYVQDIARACGVDVDTHRWGLAASGEYRSRKLLFFLFERTSETPAYVVKMTRDSSLNARLEREVRALTYLHERSIGNEEILPRVAFSGVHAGLMIVGETTVDGVSFDDRSSFDAGCPYAHDAVDWLTQFAESTAGDEACPPAEVAKGLNRLLQTFLKLYPLPERETGFLVEQIDVIAGLERSLPLVFQHGDPGRWNALVTGSGRVALLDWESAERDGMPLWDLFYFLRSFSAGIVQRGGGDSSAEQLAEQFLNETPFSRLLIESTANYCRRVAVPSVAVEPLFYTCWIHRALKEATRLPASRLQSGHYYQLLRLFLERRSAASLRRLFDLSDSYERAACSGETVELEAG